MRFSIIATALSAATASAASSTTTSSSASASPEFDIPREAIIGQYGLNSDEYPLVTSQNNKTTVVLLNTTVVKEAYEELESGKGKRDAKWGWLHFWTGQPFVKRDADAKWGWLHFWTGQPFVKRDE